METSTLKRLAAKVTLAFFIGSQLTGCLTVPNNNSGLTGVLQSAGQVASATQGSRSTSAQSINGLAQALGALQGAQSSQQAAGSRQVMQQTLGGSSPIGNPYMRPVNLSYSSTEFQSVYNRFKAAKAAAVANPRNMTEQQFYALTGATTDLMRYIDAIEARKEGVSTRKGLSKDDAAWAAFNEEAMAAAQPDSGERIEMGSALASNQFSPDRMVAWLSSEAPKANLPVINPSSSNTRPVIQARPGQASENAMMGSVMEDLKDLGLKLGFNQILSGDTSSMTYLARQFTSRKAQAIITSIPVVGNLVNLGMIAKGKNLDGSDMDNVDYAIAALGVIPVAGNIASKLGSGARVLATELRGAEAYLKNKPQIEWGLEAIGSESAEVALESAQPWMRQMVDSVASNVISGLPQTSAYAQSKNIRI